MKKAQHTLLALAAAALCGACSPSQESLSVTVSNPGGNTRSELASLPADSVAARLHLQEGEQMVVTDDNGRQLPMQVTYDGELLFPVEIAANATRTYTIAKGTPAAVKPTTGGALYPERVDDIAWENDRAAYRTYGPALQRSGEKAYGYDIWLKSVDTMVVADRYDKELHHGITYHQDHGNGMDCYSVGSTLGAGTAALLAADSSIVYPYCWKEYEILDNGPIRFTVKLTYNPFAIDGDTAVVETRLIALDQGSRLNKTTVSYSNLSKATPMVAGIVMHPENPQGYLCNTQAGYIAVEDLTDNVNNGNGKIYVGIVSPTALNATGVKPLSETEISWFRDRYHAAYGHNLAHSTYQPGSSYTYYWGGGWSKYGVADMEAWESYLSQFAQNIKQPLQITIE